MTVPIDPMDCPLCLEKIRQGSKNPYCKEHKRCRICHLYFDRMTGFKRRYNACEKHRKQLRDGVVKLIPGDCPDCLDEVAKLTNCQPQCMGCDTDSKRKEFKKDPEAYREKAEKKARKKARKKRAGKKVEKKTKKGRSLGGGRPTGKDRPAWSVALRKARLARGLSQKELAEKLNLERPRWASRWELGEMIPSESYQLELKRILGWSMHEQEVVETTPASAFGAWLQRHRIIAGLTIEELEAKSSVNKFVIAGLESDYAAEPEDHVVRQIQQALGVKVPSEVFSTSIKREERKCYVRRQFDPHTPPTKRGVYLCRLRNRPDTYLYVGSAWKDGRTIRDRVKDHLTKRWSILLGRCEYIEINEPEECKRVEDLLIQVLNPSENKNRRSDL